MAASYTGHHFTTSHKDVAVLRLYISPLHSFTLSLFHSFTLSLFHHFTLSPLHSFTTSKKATHEKR
ncbi:MAG: hypothetical protein IPN94_21555 [Sphingobacteriales bacterium]|nr:hypothetical protein [Sphingobacteriales bacterium]